MISKERLEQLIEQGATIYCIIKEPFIAGYSSVLKVIPITLDNTYGISVEEYNKQNTCKPQFYQGSFVYRDICDANDIYETEDDALWNLEMSATRTEILKMPTYENFLKDNFGVRFYNKSREFCLHKVRYSADDNNPQWRLNFYESYGDEWDTVAFEKEWDLTKENYIEACKLCLKLFKGEKEDEKYFNKY